MTPHRLRFVLITSHNMQAIEQKLYPIDDAKYGCYMDTQRRVARWVEQTNHSQSQNAVEGKGSKSRRSSTSRSRSHKRSRHHEIVGFAPPVPKLPFSSGSSVPFPGDIGVSPAIALLSSSLLVFAILPSLIAISVFAAALTYASVESERPVSRISFYRFCQLIYLGGRIKLKMRNREVDRV